MTKNGELEMCLGKGLYEYRVVHGVAHPFSTGVPTYVLREEGLEDKQGENLASILNRLAGEGWEPYHFALPIGYPFNNEREKVLAAPATIIFRREKKTD